MSFRGLGFKELVSEDNQHSHITLITMIDDPANTVEDQSFLYTECPLLLEQQHKTGNGVCCEGHFQR